MRMVRRPPRRESSGRASSAACAPPKWLMRARKVIGPTFSERIRRRQARRWLSSNRAVGSGAGLDRAPSARVSRPCTDLALRAGNQALDVGGVLDGKQNGQYPCQGSKRALTSDPKKQRSCHAGRKSRQG